ARYPSTKNSAAPVDRFTMCSTARPLNHHVAQAPSPAATTATTNTVSARVHLYIAPPPPTGRERPPNAPPPPDFVLYRTGRSPGCRVTTTQCRGLMTSPASVNRVGTRRICSTMISSLAVDDCALMLSTACRKSFTCTHVSN